MREPRPGIPWSRQRARRRCLYATWMADPAWQARRRRWRTAYLTAHGGSEPVCAICDRPWTLRSGHLHHRSYTRLGAEADRDLIPLCPHPCHETLHRILESNPAWLRTGRAYATDSIIARLRAETHRHD